MFDISLEDSIIDILKTKQGSRVMMPDYGSRLHELIDKKIGSDFLAIATSYVVEALKYEPRVNLKKIKATVDEKGVINMTVETDEVTVNLTLN